MGNGVQRLFGVSRRLHESPGTCIFGITILIKLPEHYQNTGIPLFSLINFHIHMSKYMYRKKESFVAAIN